MTWKPAKAWTSAAPRSGRRHFRLVLQGGRGPQRWVELVSVLSPEVRLRLLWSELRDTKLWQSGWQCISLEPSESD
ncbi:tryptophan-rich conserved hypothetical protein CHP02450 [Synechococcus sp. A18-25c]|uniref:TIGR02450 family Trp-rich protein n=1 Tax=unclassified Synechococcus TaxID=2626047 RepID=UPI001648BA9B|nr:MULTISPECIES: TIGR02450 family Trp-rich protein [unclassified Synechococcus]QNJ19607.1 tryptophan-rich conserved hypothetical protein CHP02450 [Synechococcus sp. A18-25c]